jgi:uncharacterized SAM-dependent methyltransferase
MKLLKNSQIAEEYKVFRGSVGKWVASALNKENNLQLEMSNEKWYIIDNPHNRSELLNLKERASKFRNKNSYQKVNPSPELYKIFGYSNLVEMITKMEEIKMIPIKFSYLNEGADIWNEFIRETFKSENYLSKIGNKLLDESLPYLVESLRKYDVINIVDVGAGNGYNLKPLIEILLKNKFEVKYTGIDISPRMLEIISKNIKDWYPQMTVETEIGDMDYIVLREKLFSNKIANENSCNLILFLGYTIGNVYDSHRVFRNFYDSMSVDDYFMFDNGLDLEKLKTVFTTLENDNYNRVVRWIPELLGITPEMFERVNKYDEKSKSRVRVLQLNIDLDIEFKLEAGTKIVSFKSGDEITVWNHFSHNLDNLISEIRGNNLGISFMARAADKSEVLMICEVDR